MGYNGFGRRFVRFGNAACSISGIVSRASTITWRGALYDVRGFSPPSSRRCADTDTVGYWNGHGITAVHRTRRERWAAAQAYKGFLVARDLVLRIPLCAWLLSWSLYLRLPGGLLILSSLTRVGDSDSLMKNPRCRSAFTTRVKAISSPFYCEYGSSTSISGRHSGSSRGMNTT